MSSQTASEASSKVSIDASPSIAALVRGWPARAGPSSPAPALSFSQAVNAFSTAAVTLGPPAHTKQTLITPKTKQTKKLKTYRVKIYSRSFCTHKQPR